MAYSKFKFFDYLIMIFFNIFFWSIIFDGIFGFTKDQVFYPLLISLCIFLMFKFYLVFQVQKFKYFLHGILTLHGWLQNFFITFKECVLCLVYMSFMQKFQKPLPKFSLSKISPKPLVFMFCFQFCLQNQICFHVS